MGSHRRWHFAVHTREGRPDPSGERIAAELRHLGRAELAPVRVTRLFLLGGDLDEACAHRLAKGLLADPVVETCDITEYGEDRGDGRTVTVCRKPGVMDPSEESILRGARRLGCAVSDVRTGTSYRFATGASADLAGVVSDLLANAVVDEVLPGTTRLPASGISPAYAFERVEVPLGDDDQLMETSRSRGLSLDLEEMRAIRAHFAALGRDPSDLELETLAQTWSEHCKHKTFTADVDMDGRRIENLLKSTVFEATRRLDSDLCVSVFSDNAGIIRFDERYNLCFKVETHNHPSAIEPYGGAGTGLGGVIRDILGTGLGGKPVANIDVFCVGRPDAADLPDGVIHPLRVLKGVVAGVRDYGNRMGIPTVSGAVLFDERYTGNPLVYCGTVGLIPVDKCSKEARPGDHIVVLGGRTGRDGIHGATFSSRELHTESESLDGGAVQIGNAITEKATMDALLEARDRGLYTDVTDCGAGGFSSAVGEMGEKIGAEVELSQAPLKYPGLTYREIWLSEAQERMVIGVPPEHLEEVLELCASEDVETCVLGRFTATGDLVVKYDGNTVVELPMAFLHDGLPRRLMKAEWSPPDHDDLSDLTPPPPSTMLRRLLGDPDIASKEWIIRQYDHEVLGGSVVKPLVGVTSDGPGDASVVAPVLGSTKGFAVGLGINPHYADLDPYHMACAAIDEALRNVVCVGGDPARTAILDNFSWGNTAKPDRLGALVRASEGCHDTALAFETPFISGKDSLNNEYQTPDGTIAIPHTLLISALAIVEDVRESVTMDLKREDSVILVVGATRDERGASAWLRLQGRLGSGVPVLADGAAKVHRGVHALIREGLVRACHDCSEGGLAVAAAEMAFAGGIGLELDLRAIPREGDLNDDGLLFSESLTRFIVEVDPTDVARIGVVLDGLTFAECGRTGGPASLRVKGIDGATVIDEELETLRTIHGTSLTSTLEGTNS